MPAYSNRKLSTTPALLTTSEAALLTAPAGKRYKITAVNVCEYSGSASTVTLRKYDSALANAAANNLYTAVAVGANTTVKVEEPEGLYLEDGEILAGLAGHNSRLNYSINYEVEK